MLWLLIKIGAPEAPDAGTDRDGSWIGVPEAPDAGTNSAIEGIGELRG